MPTMNAGTGAEESALANRRYGAFIAAWTVESSHGAFAAGWTVEDCNDALCRALGLERHELIGKTALQLSPPVQADGALSPERWQRREHAARAGMQQWFQWQFLKRDGNPAHSLVHLSTLDGDHGPRLLAQVHDLSRLRGAGWALEESERRLQDVLDNTKAVIFAKDREGRYIFVNHELERSVRRPASEIVGRTDLEIWPLRLAGLFRNNDLKVLEQGQAIEFEVTDDTRGRPRVLHSFKFPLFDLDGVPYAVCGISTDVSERKRIEDALRRAALAVSSAQGPTVFQELVRFLATTLEVDGAFIAAPAAPDPCTMRMHAFYLDGEVRENFDYAIAGTPCEAVVGQSFKIYPARLRDSFPADTDLARIGLESYAGFPLSASSGAPLGLIGALSRSPMRDSGFVESMLKIFAARAAAELERLKNEETLRASEEQYRQIFNASADGMVLRDAEYRVVDANPAALAMSGYSREEVIGTDRALLRAADLTLSIRSRLRNVLAGERVRFEGEAIGKDGRRIEIEFRGMPVQYRGRPHVLTISHDLTERRRAEAERTQLEAQLRQAQKMEAIGHLTGGIAHDFNNLLTTILGYVVLASERESRAGDDRLGRYLGQARLACERARDLIRQMLTFSRGQRGEPRPLSLPPLVKESVKLFRSSLPSTIEIETDLEQEVPTVMLDPVHVDQMLLNLCLNARDAMDAVGTIRVAVRAVSGDHGTCTACRNAVGGDRVELSIEDDGPGIAPGILDRIFEPFFTTKEAGKGSGMGLAMVHGIVHEHSGHVIVDTAPGEGARFRVLFEALPQAAGTRVAAATETGGMARLSRVALSGHVLVVDDEASVAGFMRELLETWGLEVTVAQDGAQARELVGRAPSRYDLVVTDQLMPRITGMQLARELLIANPRLPILLYTGFSDNLSEVEIKRAGIRALLRKPVDADALYRLLAAHLPAAERAR